MYYRHNLDYKYPNRSDEHMISIKRKYDIKFDENYSYLNKKWHYKFLRGCYFILLNTIIFPLLRLTHGLKIYGKENIKKHKKEFKNGAITISNHVFYWDYLCVCKTIRPHLSYFPAWKMNLYGSGGPFIRLAGGIPIPTDNMRAMVKFNKAIEEVIESGKWLHFFPEGSMWLFYPDVRPLKKAVFKYAVKFNKPIIPMSFSFRERKGITKLFTKKPFVDLHIGEPLFVNKELPKLEAEEDLKVKANHIMQVMCGVNPGDKTYNTDLNIENYKKTM